MASEEAAIVVELNDKPEFQRILPGAPQTCGMKAGRVHLEAGKACGEHSTKENEEILVFLSGTGELLIGEERRAIKVCAGRAAYIRPQTIHDVKNTGSEPLTYIYCEAPAGV
jgi:mannose-6-phosphate isomerase-like protein (cupin superfamily)